MEGVGSQDRGDELLKGWIIPLCTLCIICKRQPIVKRDLPHSVFDFGSPPKILEKIWFPVKLFEI